MRGLFWNTHEHRLRAGWRIVSQLLLLLLLAALLGLPLLFVLAAAGLLALSESTAAAVGLDQPTVLALYGGLTVLLATLVSVWVAGRWLDHRPFADFGFHLSRAWWLDFGFGLALGAFLMAAIFLVEWAAGWLTVANLLHAGDPAAPFALAILAPLAIYVAVGIYEELLSRGYLLRNLAEGLNLPSVGPGRAILLAWLLSSAVFGLGHAGNPNASAASTLALVLAGLFLGLGYVLTGELAIPIGLHITWNFFQGNVFGFPVSGGRTSPASFVAIRQGGPDLWTGGAFGPEAGLLGVLAMLAGSGLIVLWVRRRHGQARLDHSLAVPPLARHARGAS